LKTTSQNSKKGILKRVGPAKGGHWEIDPELANNLNKT